MGLVLDVWVEFSLFEVVEQAGWFELEEAGGYFEEAVEEEVFEIDGVGGSVVCGLE